LLWLDQSLFIQCLHTVGAFRSLLHHDIGHAADNLNGLLSREFLMPPTIFVPRNFVPLYLLNIHNGGPKALGLLPPFAGNADLDFLIWFFAEDFSTCQYLTVYSIETLSSRLVFRSSWRLRLEPADIALPDRPLIAELNGRESLSSNQLKDRLP
jgi:hypothetical protein